MYDKVAKPRRVMHSESLDRLTRLRMDYAVKPFDADNDRWATMRVSVSPEIQHRAKEKTHKRMIKEVHQGVKGLDFPAEEMAKIIRGWLAQDEK